MAIAIFERTAFDQNRSIVAALQAAIASDAAELVSGAAELHQVKPCGTIVSPGRS
jgi:hypothetical protein